MKVVYVGLRQGTCLSRFKGLQKLVEGAEFFSIDPYFVGRGKLYRALQEITFLGSRHAEANQDLVKFCRLHDPEVVWIDKCEWVWPSTLKILRAQNRFLVHHLTDALFPHRWRVRRAIRMLRRNLHLFDINFTSNADDCVWMNRQSGIRAELTQNAFDADCFNNAPLPPELAKKWSNEIIFVGHYEPRTERGILALIDAGLPVKVYGPLWHQARHKDRLRGVAQFARLSDEDYVYALKGAKIGLCFLSEMNYNRTTGRSFEIPACGTFMLGMRTNQHLELYKEGEEAEFFADTDELVRKARYYLENNEKRREIARRGHERCTQSDYSWQRFMRDDWAKVLAAMNRAASAGAT